LILFLQHLLSGLRVFEESICQKSSIGDNYSLRRLLQDHSDPAVATSTDTLEIVSNQELKFISKSSRSFKVSGLLVLYRLIDLCELLLDRSPDAKAIHPQDPGLIAELTTKSKACSPALS
jgi:hypothetical protein